MSNVAGVETHGNYGSYDVNNDIKPQGEEGGKIVFQDGIAQGDGSVSVQIYRADPQYPALYFPNPDVNSEEPTTQADASSEPSFSMEYYQAFGEHLDQLIDQYHLTEEQAQLLIFAHMMGIAETGDPVVDEAMKTLDAELYADVVSTWDFPTEQDKKNWKNQLDPVKTVYKNSLTTAYKGKFDQELEKYADEHGLTDEEKAQLKFLFNHPDYLPDADPEIADHFDHIEANAQGALEITWAQFPENYGLPVDNTHFDAEIMATNDHNFAEALNQGIESGAIDLSALAEELGISEDDVRQRINYLHYNPGATFSGSDRLTPIVTGLEGTALENTRSTQGIVGDYIPEANDLYYNGRFEGVFNYDFAEGIKALPSEDRAAVMAMLEEPVDPDIVNNPLFQRIRAGVIEQFHLPETWMPPLEGLNYLTNVPPHIGILWDGLSQSEEAIRTATAQVESMEDSPMKQLLLNFLKIVSEALASLKELIAATQITDAQISKDRSQVKLETSLMQIDLDIKKREEAKKVAEDNKPKKSMQIFMNIMKKIGPVMEGIVLAVVSAVLIAATLGTATPFVAGLVMAFVATSIAMYIATQAAPEKVTAMFQNMVKGLAKVFGNSKAAKVFEMALTFCFAFMGGSSGLGSFFESGVFQKHLIEVYGASPEVAMGVSTAFMVVAEIAMIVLVTVLTAGTGTSLKVAKFAGKIAQQVGKGAEVVAKGLKAVASPFSRCGRVGAAVEEMIEYIATRFMSWSNDFSAWGGKLLKCVDDIKKAEKAVKQAKEAGDIAREAKAATELKEALNAFDKLTNTILGQILKKLFTLTDRIQYVGGITVGAINQQRFRNEAKFEKFKAEIEALVEELKAFVKMLEKLIAKMMAGAEDLGDWMQNLGEMMEKGWADKSRFSPSNPLPG